MKLIKDRSKMVMGEYYLIYEMMDGRAENSIVIGALTSKDGNHFTNPIFLGNCRHHKEGGRDFKERWFIYGDEGGFVSTQLIFKLSHDEVLEHVVVESI